MKRWTGRVIAALLILGASIWLWTVLFPSPERAIRKRLLELAKSASFAGNESPLAKLSNSQRVAGFFTADVEVRVDAPGRGQQVISGRETLFQSMMQARSALSGLQVEFYDINVTVAPGKQSAEVSLTLRARIAGERDQAVQELKLFLNKTEGNWRINRAQTVKTLSLCLPVGLGPARTLRCVPTVGKM